MKTKKSLSGVSVKAGQDQKVLCESIGVRLHLIRKIFRDAFAAAGLPYYNPHSFRNSLVILGQTICQSTEEYKAWSQNLGHEGVLTTFYSYGEVEEHRQWEIFRDCKLICVIAYH